MTFKANNPGCNCCQLNCDDCNSVTTVAVNIPEIDCAGTTEDRPAMCTRNNGTYVFRTVFTNTGFCLWRYTLAGELCLINDGGSYYAQTNFSCYDGVGDSFYIQFLSGGSGVIVRFTITRTYYTVSNGNISRYAFVFEDSFPTCADAVGATLPFVSKSETVCGSSSTGDICFIEANAVVTLG